MPHSVRSASEDFVPVQNMPAMENNTANLLCIGMFGRLPLTALFAPMCASEAGGARRAVKGRRRIALLKGIITPITSLKYLQAL